MSTRTNRVITRLSAGTAAVLAAALTLTLAPAATAAPDASQAAPLSQGAQVPGQWVPPGPLPAKVYVQKGQNAVLKVEGPIMPTRWDVLINGKWENLPKHPFDMRKDVPFYWNGISITRDPNVLSLDPSWQFFPGFENQVRYRAGNAETDYWPYSSTTTIVWVNPPGDFYRPGFGFAPLSVINGSTEELFLRGISGADELPSGSMILTKGASVRTGWHWIHAGLNEWFDLRIGDTGWNVRVKYEWNGVDCRFWSDQGGPANWTYTGAPFSCVNGAGTDRYVGRGTSDELSSLTIR